MKWNETEDDIYLCLQYFSELRDLFSGSHGKLLLVLYTLIYSGNKVFVH